MDIDVAIGLIETEVRKASAKHPSMHSHHEAYAVIKEEFDEYWAEVMKGGSTPRDARALGIELIQTAAMCVRALTDLCNLDYLNYRANLAPKEAPKKEEDDYAHGVGPNYTCSACGSDNCWTGSDPMVCKNTGKEVRNA